VSTEYARVEPREARVSTLVIADALLSDLAALPDAARWYLDVFLDGRGAASDPRLSRDFRYRIDCLPSPTRPHLAARIQDVALAFPRRTRALTALSRDGALIRVTFDIEARHEGPLFRLLAPTGRKVRVRVHHCIELSPTAEGFAIASDGIAFDAKAVIRQLTRGARSIPPR
jgi:hypothetical protein